MLTSLVIYKPINYGEWATSILFVSTMNSDFEGCSDVNSID